MSSIIDLSMDSDDEELQSRRQKKRARQDSLDENVNDLTDDEVCILGTTGKVGDDVLSKTHICC